MTIDFSFLQDKVNEYMKLLRQDLFSILRQKYPDVIINEGSWRNQKFFTSYVSIFTTGDYASDSIDSIIQIAVYETYYVFHADISMSNGNLIAEIINDKNINYSDIEISSKLNRLCKNSINKFRNKINEMLIS